jgi:hypothetical protein
MGSVALLDNLREEIDLTELIPKEEWEHNRPVIELATRRGYPFALGGGLAFSAYSGRWRNTKDLDLFILPEDRQAMIDLVTELGFEDYFAQKEYDRSWIYRAHKEGVIVDLIWSMPNHRMDVDHAWLECGPDVRIHDALVRILPSEELLWSKLFVLQKDRCDWPDLLNILHGAGDRMDWGHLLDRVGEDVPVLRGLMSVYGWMCPKRALAMPEWIWFRLGLPQPRPHEVMDEDGCRAPLLDTRDWFGPNEKG